MPTIYKVAKAAGVSTATVSRVMSGVNAVSALTRARVMEAVETLGYTPNSAARNLRTQRSGKILVTVPDISNPFFSLILQGIEDAALQAGYAVLIGDTQHEAAREDRYAQMLQRKEADGLIFLGHRLPGEAARLIRAAAHGRAPIVNGCEFSPRLGVPSVHIDNARASQEAMDASLSASATGESPWSPGRSSARSVAIGCVAPGGRPGRRRRAPDDRARRRFLDRLGHDRRQPAAGVEPAADRSVLLQRRDGDGPDGHRAPPRRQDSEDLSVVGFDDIRFARYLDPPLTTVTQPMREIGEGCVQLLLEILRGGDATPPP